VHRSVLPSRLQGGQIAAGRRARAGGRGRARDRSGSLTTVSLGEIFFLEDLAADCAADGRYAFLLVAPPLPVTRAVGTPINPYALK
jgi:hypothetical protein